MVTHHFLSLPQKITGVVILFLLIGQIMIFSATGIMGIQQHGSEFYYVLRQAICAILGLALMFLTSRIRYQFWARVAYLLLFVQIALMAATLIPSIGHYAQGAGRWLKFGPFTFQPSELAKFTLTLFVAYYLANSERKHYPVESWVIHAGFIATLLYLIFRQPDLGSTVCLTCVIFGLFFLSGARLRYLVGPLAAGLGLTIFAMLHSEYRRRRLMAFLNPWADPQGDGFQTIQSFLSIHSGRIFGAGIGNGNSKLFFLPEVHTDFIFALIGEELGFLGSFLCLALFLYFGYLIFKVAFRAPDTFGRLLAFGLSLSLLLQVAVNLGAVTGLIPVKGLPLPFISWGRSALIVNLLMVGILLNIARQSIIIQKSTIAGQNLGG